MRLAKFDVLLPPCATQTPIKVGRVGRPSSGASPAGQLHICTLLCLSGCLPIAAAAAAVIAWLLFLMHSALCVLACVHWRLHGRMGSQAVRQRMSWDGWPHRGKREASGPQGAAGGGSLCDTSREDRGASCHLALQGLYATRHTSPPSSMPCAGRQ